MSDKNFIKIQADFFHGDIVAIKGDPDMNKYVITAIQLEGRPDNVTYRIANGDLYSYAYAYQLILIESAI